MRILYNEIVLFLYDILKFVKRLFLFLCIDQIYVLYEKYV